MENRSFEGELPGGNPPEDPKDDLPGPLNPGVDISGENKDQITDNIPPLRRISDDEDDESLPAYKNRYETPVPKTDNFEDLDPPPPEPVEEPHDIRSDPELQQQAKRRRERRNRQMSVEGPCSLRPDRPTFAPPPIPEPYPGPDIEPKAANEPDPRQQDANAPECGQQATNTPESGHQATNAPESVQQTVSAPQTIWERCFSFYRQINAFTFQFPFHTLLLTWPLSTGIMGALNLTVCNMNYYFPGLMIAIGLLGTAAVLLRLYVLYYEKKFAPVGNTLWIVIRALELAIWVLFASQLYYFFEQNPSFTPGAKRYCKPRIYKINCGLMFLTSATMIGWMVVNIGNFIHWISSRNELPST